MRGIVCDTVSQPVLSVEDGKIPTKKVKAKVWFVFPIQQDFMNIFPSLTGVTQNQSNSQLLKVMHILISAC